MCSAPFLRALVFEQRKSTRTASEPTRLSNQPDMGHGICGPPSITVSALSRDTYLVEGFCFSFVESFCFCSCLCLALIAPRLAFRILRWKLGSTNHLSGHA